MEKVRFGIVGLGNQGSAYANEFFVKGKVVNGVLTAVCDNDPKKIEIFKQNVTENVKFFSDYKEMIDSGEIDAVLVDTPHYDHPEITSYALSHGVHALCDKPAGVYTKQVREMNETADKSDKIFGMMFNQRANCLYRKMRELIVGGEIGEIIRVNWIITDWYRSQKYYDSGSWRATWKGEGGGVLINQCPHQLDLVSWITGMQPKKVNGFVKYGHFHDIEVEDEVTAYFEYENGATGVFITTTGEAPGTNRFEVSGTLGKILCEGGKLILSKNAEDLRTFTKTFDQPFGRPKVEVKEVETDGENLQHVAITNNFANAILGKEELFVSGKEGIKGVELMNAIELSGWKNGKTVTIPVNEKEYLKQLNKRRKNSKLKEVGEVIVADTRGTYGSK
ncbi:MAG: Gfo/Idh/MocA family oxidoreductase [Clostridia bacterium]|nr:Gfo/Idh/MocA family oxidoreductase [Clostridia bacterium]